MTRLSLRAFDPILVRAGSAERERGGRARYLVASRSRFGPEAIGALGWCGYRDGVVFPIFVSMALKFVPATHASVLGSILRWQPPCLESSRARIGFAPILVLRNSRGQA